MSTQKSTSYQCLSVRNQDESQYQCAFYAISGEKYCPVHLAQDYIQDYHPEVELDTENKVPPLCKRMVSTIVPDIDITDYFKKTDIPKEPIPEKPIAKVAKKQDVLIDQKKSQIESSIRDTNEDLEVKLLILLNTPEINSNLENLIGPVYNNIVISEDQHDPITYDKLWDLAPNGTRIPTSTINKYYLFSYRDNSGAVRCFTIFTIYQMLRKLPQDGILRHPTTMEPISPLDIKRARALIDIYQSNLNLFEEQAMTREYALQSRVSNMFKTFYSHSIFVEDKWLLGINDKIKLLKIMSETKNLIQNNYESIINKPNLKCKSVKTPRVVFFEEIEKKGFSQRSILEMIEYIVSEWEKMLQLANNPQNQIPIWIIIASLAKVEPEIYVKYADLNIMFG
jgi:hypothetical protein